MVTGLAPVVGERVRVLVLGSMPGARSLAEGRYYVGPGNRFWKVMAEVLGFDPGLDYAAKIRRLTASGVALWDVLKHCERDGSLDSSIVASSEEPNDFAGFLSRYPDLRAVVLNGQKAGESFNSSFDGARVSPPSMTLPSTSGANARKSLEELVEEWRVISDYLD